MIKICGALGVTGAMLLLGGCNGSGSASAAPQDQLLSVEARAATCLNWSQPVAVRLASDFAQRAITDHTPVSFARSVPESHVVSVYINSEGCETQPVNTRSVLTEEIRPGGLYVEIPNRSDGVTSMYSMVEIDSSQPGATRTFILSTKQVTAVVVRKGSGRPT